MNFKVIPYTLIFIKNQSQILLGLKKRGLGKDKWNGFGGKIESNETAMEGAVREVKEESNLLVDKLNHIGVLIYEHFARTNIPNVRCPTVDVVHVFTTSRYSGDLAESEEMLPEWYNISDIPYDKMWADAKDWHPLMLNDQYFIAHVIYENDNITQTDVKQYESLSTVLKQLEKIMQDTYKRN